ncbi:MULTISPECIES: SLC13 family permease [Methanoculleus]|jgi:Na+/H+ antiporter NhaD/arsenite permease-like protein|uniref:Na+/H+ antiporter NhaD n=1 Tax=Methanoculleus thermophilus TaxID=2200 RepID=A0A1G8X0Q1_9EURY|nr:MULTISPECIES: ArsB/NhaD family transporter [Methanoculleus]SDJ84014.1 Na+/H+ antiporter NhaD [Methanoculleus thermophilus]HQD26279.1 ArsB/NhaD family transporter [Methanoculleus thermophilus]
MIVGPELIAIAVFLFTYALIIDERIHRAVVAMLGASIVVLLHIVPWEMIPEYIDLGTIFLLIGMMIIVNTARGSGLFEYIAIKTAKLAKGSPMRVLILFSIVTGLTSAFLDNVTTVLLITPMLLYVASVMKTSPMPFLIAEIFASNIGGAATLIGDPPNIMIGSAAGLTFNEFIINMAPMMAVNLLVVLGLLALIYRKDLHVSPDERESIERTFAELKDREAIRDWSLFKKSVIVIALVIGMFFIHDQLGLEPALVALIGASILLFWSRQSPEEIFEKIEWPALFFFGGLFVVVGALVETGVIASVAQFVVENVHSEGEAILIIAWFSAIASAIVDNIPLTATLIPLIQDMSVAMDIYPLWWALSLGACLGGNGTVIGASANVVVLGIAARNGYSISFMEFLKIGMLVLFITVAIGTAFLWFNYVVL